MGWVIFFICAITLFLFTSLKKWKTFWHAGVITLIINYFIDSTLIALGAFSYRYPNPIISELPTLYWLSAFFGGIVLVRYYPQRKLLQLPYILLSSSLFLCLELIVVFFGYFYYHNWSPLNSFFLDIFGFIIVIWLWNWINDIKTKASSTLQK